MDVTEARPPARGKLVDLLLIVGTALLVLVTVGITLLGNLVQRTSGKLGELIGVGAGTLASGLVHAASFVLSILVVLLLYRFVPARRLRFRDGLVGAIVTALLLRLISLASGWIYERTTRLSVVHGSLTSAGWSSSTRCISTPPPCSWRRGSCRMVAAAASRGRADPHPAETGPARTLRQAEGLAGR
jgi:prepilin signal peptidase PulO-like enzyme (type II secretory pathway)